MLKCMCSHRTGRAPLHTEREGRRGNCCASVAMRLAGAAEPSRAITHSCSCSCREDEPSGAGAGWHTHICMRASCGPCTPCQAGPRRAGLDLWPSHWPPHVMLHTHVCTSGGACIHVYVQCDPLRSNSKDRWGSKALSTLHRTAPHCTALHRTAPHCLRARRRIGKQSTSFSLIAHAHSPWARGP